MTKYFNEGDTVTCVSCGKSEKVTIENIKNWNVLEAFATDFPNLDIKGKRCEFVLCKEHFKIVFETFVEKGEQLLHKIIKDVEKSG